VKAVFRFPHREPVEASATGWFALLRRHLVLVLTIKLALLALLFFVFFSAAHRPSPGPAAVSEALHLSR
jgi:hypothetical protein